METQTQTQTQTEERTEERFTELFDAKMIKLPLYSAGADVSPWERFGCLTAEEQTKVYNAGERMWGLQKSFNKLHAAGVLDVPVEHWKPALLRSTPWQIFVALPSHAQARILAAAKDLAEDRAIFEKLSGTGLLPEGTTWESLKAQDRSFRTALFEAASGLAKARVKAGKKSLILGIVALVATFATLFAFAFSGTWVFRAVVSIFALDLPNIGMFPGFVLHSILFSAHTLAAMNYIKSEMPEMEPTDFPEIDKRNADFRYQLRLHGTLTASALFEAALCWGVTP